ncbi:PREDICTED: uncharacterized protein LOC108663603 [Theobroma cacao]|uniref:Uncharacterized protein LOC108663603 n=1 Tax=Theobroma cacao TaxID=3641 RepID=A0AB32WXM0_THECC|nr:PREDICTED: uncharacterized protein LOC108663603 [Theobroma cacao]
MGNLASQVAALSKKLDTMGVHVVQNSFVVCEMCGDGPLNDQCPYNFESVQFVGNFNRQLNNPYSNTYNPSWRNHPNFSWNNNARPSNPKPNMPLGFQQQVRPLVPEKKSQVEELLLQYISKNDAIIQSFGASLRNLEAQIGQLANSVKNRPQGVNEKVVELENEDVDKEGICEKESEVDQKEDVKAENHGTSQVIHPPPPFPQRLQKQKLEKKFQKFIDVFKKLHINIPFAEAFEQMPSYVKFLKDILSKKRKLGEFETVSLTEECSAIFRNKLPPKLKDPSSFTILCIIGNLFFAKALSDLGVSINLMPWSIFEKLSLGEYKPTSVTLQLADRSYVYLRGIIEDVLVKVDKFIFPIDFIILDMEEDRQIPIILGRPFLATARALIDVEKGELTLRIQDQ